MTRKIHPPSPSPEQHRDGDERLFARPDFDLPVLGDVDLTMLSDSILMSMFHKAIAWQNFADSMSTEAEIREANLALELDTAESVAVIDAWNSASTTVGPRGGVRSDFSATVAKAQRDTTPGVQSLRGDHLRAKASRKRAQTVRDNSERIANLLSRELSRRIGRDPVDRRAGRYLT